jgi:hypothetical protein
VTSPETAPNRHRVVAAIPEHTVPPLPWFPVRCAAEESQPPKPGLLASRSGWRRSDARRAVTPRPSQIRSRLLPRLARSLDSDRPGHRVHRMNGTTVHDRPRPINLVVARAPLQERKVDRIPHARLLPVAHATLFRGAVEKPGRKVGLILIGNERGLDFLFTPPPRTEFLTLLPRTRVFVLRSYFLSRACSIFRSRSSPSR